MTGDEVVDNCDGATEYDDNDGDGFNIDSDNDNDNNTSSTMSNEGNNSQGQQLLS